MCKMLFIGTKGKLQAMPLEKKETDFYIEEISGEFLSIKRNFKNPNVYVVGTSRGCSCDFGIKSNRRDLTTIEKTPPIQNLLNKFRKLSGTLKKWKHRHQEKVENAIEAQANYLTQTLKLVDIILSETKKANKVEMFCVWAGDYSATPEFHETIDTSKIDLKEDFEITEMEFTVFE